MYVTGTFDDWGKTVQLEREGDIFAKKVSLPVTGEKVQYKVRWSLFFFLSVEHCGGPFMPDNQGSNYSAYRGL